MTDYNEFDGYNEFDDIDDAESEEDFDCGAYSDDGIEWRCADLGTESCSFFCPYHAALLTNDNDVVVESILLKPFVWEEVNGVLLAAAKWRDITKMGDIHEYFSAISYDVPYPPASHPAWERILPELPF